MTQIDEPNLDEQIQKILEHKPREDAPDNFWDNGDIRTTWTGIWLDAYGEWDEMPASEVYPITYFLSEKAEEWFVKELKALIANQVEQARGCVDCKKLMCENCERLWQT